MDTLTQLMQFAGELCSASFVLVALGDLFTSLGNTIIQKVIAPRDTPWSTRIVFYWSVVTDLYEDLRAFLNRISLYSRPRKTEKK